MLIDKPVGWTSHDVVAVVRKQLGIRAVGHAGTLDPFATGLLVVLVGRSTRLARFVESERKVYRAVVELGVGTDTEDSTGTVIESVTPDCWPSESEIDHGLSRLTGSILQRPPIYSAKHVAGKRSHALARAGKAVELPEVSVEVHRVEIIDWDEPRLEIEAEVGKGTYLRSFARDLGGELGLPAHCSALRRLSVGRFDISGAKDPREVGPEDILPASEVVAHLDCQQLDEANARELGFGRRVERTVDGHGPAALVADDGRLVAVAELADDGRWQPIVVMEPAG